jgi:hypothetical protein
MQSKNSNLNKKMKTKMTTLPLTNSISRPALRLAFLLIPLAIALAWFALSPTAQAQLPSPTPDGGYPGNNTAEGDGALSSVQFNATTGFGTNNTANGADALFHNIDGFDNTASGAGALFSNISGFGNTATGFNALNSNTSGESNTATGGEALSANTIGGSNTANGQAALGSNTIGNFNTATGASALQRNTTGRHNTANGWSALFSNTGGTQNTANGVGALFNNNADNNTANGYVALNSNTGGTQNTANGGLALLNNTRGGNNTANGFGALGNNTTGSNNIALGSDAGSNLTTGSNNIDIGANVLGVAGESNHIRIGTAGTQKATFIAGIHEVTVASAVGVVVDLNGHLGTVTSSARFKQDIKPMDKASEAILALQPVTFRYKPELDPGGIPQFGLVAEQVEKVNPDLVVRDAEGQVNTVRYEAVNAMLLNEFLKEHRKVEEQQATIAQFRQDFQSRLAEQQKQIEALTAGLQKVSAQVETSHSAPQVRSSNQ